MSELIRRKLTACEHCENSVSLPTITSGGENSGYPIRQFARQEDLSDGFLLAQISVGDTQCFWILWMRYERYLYGLYFRLCKGNRQDTDDTLSGFCLRLNNQIPMFAAGILNIKTWLRRSAYNYFIDTHRSAKRTPLATGSLEELATLADGRQTSGHNSPEAELINRQLLEKALQAMKLVGNDKQRQAMHMRFIEEMSYGEIAEELHVSEALVRKWIQGMRNKLRATVSY